MGSPQHWKKIKLSEEIPEKTQEMYKLLEDWRKRLSKHGTCRRRILPMGSTNEYTSGQSDGQLQQVSVRVHDLTFVVAIAGSAGAIQLRVAICYQLPGEFVYRFPAAQAECQVGEAPLKYPFSLIVHLRSLHDFQACASFKTQEIRFQLLSRVMVLFVTAGAKVFDVKVSASFQVLRPEGQVFYSDRHKCAKIRS